MRFVNHFNEKWSMFAIEENTPVIESNIFGKLPDQRRVTLYGMPTSMSS
jgi:hypothetical protein